MLVLVAWVACESMEPSADPFAPVPPPAEPVAAAPIPPELAFPSEPPLKLSSEEMATGTVAPATAAGVDAEALVPSEPAGTAAPPPSASPTPVGLPPDPRWPVRLVSTLPQAQPPRAVLGLPSGQEVVVAPGSMLASEGLVVVAVTADGVQLAKVSPAGDHAVIESVTLVPQYPAPR